MDPSLLLWKIVNPSLLHPAQVSVCKPITLQAVVGLSPSSVSTWHFLPFLLGSHTLESRLFRNNSLFRTPRCWDESSIARTWDVSRIGQVDVFRCGAGFNVWVRTGGVSINTAVIYQIPSHFFFKHCSAPRFITGLLWTFLNCLCRWWHRLSSTGRSLRGSDICQIEDFK